MSRKRGRRSLPEMHETDVLVGQQVRLARIERGWSQSKLGEQLGISFQQVQKYERGMNRISAGMLLALHKALKQPLCYFFNGTGEAAPEIDLGQRSILELHKAALRANDPMMVTELAKLLRVWAGRERSQQ